MVESQWGPPDAGGPASARLASSLAGGASLREAAGVGGAGGARGWVLDDRGTIGSLGAALVWAGRYGVEELHLLVDSAGGRGEVAGVLARRARLWATPPTVWTVEGRELRPAEPAPLPAPVEPPAAAREWIGVLAEHGLDVSIEGGVITGELLGLEVARVVPDTGGAGAGWHVEVGVGRHDREATQELRPDEPLGEALDRVVSVVRSLRVAGSTRGPGNTLARERWLRSVVVARPELVGARQLEAVALPVAGRGLLRPSPAAAAGVSAGADRSPVVAVCSVGVDPDLVPTAADVRDLLERSGALAADGPAVGRGARLALVVPEGDDYPVTRQLAAALAEPAEVVVVPKDWASLG